MFGRSTGSSRPSPEPRSVRRASGLAAATTRLAALTVAVVLAGVVIVASLAAAGRPARAADGEARLFGLLDLSAQRAPEALRLEIERWAALRGLKTLPDQGMRRALSGPEPAGVLVARLALSARAKQEAGDCAAAVAQATLAEVEALGTLTVDDEREPLKSLYVTLILCEDQLGHAERARAAGTRLRTLASLPPSPLSPELWDLYAATAAPPPASPPPASSRAASSPASPRAASSPAGAPAAASMVELQIDSEPPNARVAINFHPDGLTPRTLKVAPGLVYVELEKDGYKKAFRKITVGQAPVRAELALTERREDRAAQVESTVARLHGIDPARYRTTLARLAELARVDVLVAIAVNAGTVKVWWFDADRGELVGAPVESRLDPKTGRWAGADAALGAPD
jgi:hypothetical protein